MKPIIFLTMLLLSQMVEAALGNDIHNLQVKWAQAYYQLDGDRQKSAFENDIKRADEVVANYPNEAAPLIWRGIIKATYAGKIGGLGALSLAKSAKTDIEKALAIDSAVSDSAYATLATLYFRVPGWPIGFGDNDKAAHLFQKALSINPDSIDSNYLYAEYLIDHHHYKEAEKYLIKAKHAPARPDRPLADKGRHKQIEEALIRVHEKMQEKTKHTPF